MTRTVLIGPTGAGIRTVNVATGPSGSTGLWEQCGYTGHGPTGRYETVQVAATRDNRFKSIVVAGYTGTVTADAGGALPPPPTGFNYIVNADGKYLVNSDGSYILAKV